MLMPKMARLIRPRSELCLALAALFACACDGDKKPDAGALSASASASVAPDAKPVTSALPPPKPQVACRAMQVSGKAGFHHGIRIQKNAVIDGKRWLELDKDAVVELRHATSAREFTIKGPALVLPCMGGEEDMLVSSGVVETGVGAGVRPGAQVNVATPLGTASYGDAALSIRVSNTKVEFTISNGGALVQPFRPSTQKDRAPLDTNHRKLTLTGALTPAAVESRDRRLRGARREGRGPGLRGHQGPARRRRIARGAGRGARSAAGEGSAALPERSSGRPCAPRRGGPKGPGKAPRSGRPAPKLDPDPLTGRFGIRKKARILQRSLTVSALHR